MKKKIGLMLMSLVTLVVILVGCGNNQASAANEKEDSTLLKPGTVWKEEVGGLVHSLKIIDDTTWEYSESVWHPEPVQITVKRQSDYEGLEKYKIVDSGGADFVLGDTVVVVPYQKDGVTTVNFVSVGEDENSTKEELIDEYSGIDNYKLQK
ncbi:hypothetical protein B835_2051 [Enterococcus mundtii 3F]|uniref:hypothetical protein n=1 Tax=Enterococcus mundtii TaxID=53346 RepID=UPI002304A130|nr:hypothetical protein [Enterococcus mundtii]MDA9462122.1 hypothetical protein [Enterococcus mundtii 3F]